MKRIIFTYLNDIRASIILLFINFYLFVAFYPYDFFDILPFTHRSQCIRSENIFPLEQVYKNLFESTYYLRLGIWIIPPFIYSLYKKKWKKVGILLLVFCIPIFRTEISYKTIDYANNRKKNLAPCINTKRDKLAWRLMDCNKNIISGIYSLSPICFYHNKAAIGIRNNWKICISNNDITITPDSNRHIRKGISFIYIDTKGKLALPKIFQYASPFNKHGLAICCDSFYGIIDTSGKEIVPFDYDEITPCSNSYRPQENYHLLRKDMKYSLFCDLTHSIILDDCSNIHLYSDRGSFTKNGKDSILILYTKMKFPHIHKQEDEHYPQPTNYPLLNIKSSLKRNSNIIRKILINQQDFQTKVQNISDHLYDETQYTELSNYLRSHSDSTNTLFYTFQTENKLYNKWWKYHEHMFSMIHLERYNLNVQKILRLVYTYNLCDKEQSQYTPDSIMNKRSDFFNWNDSIVNCYNNLIQMPYFSPLAIRHIHNEMAAWQQLIDYKINLLNEVKNGDYPSRLKHLLNDEIKDFLLIQLKQMKLLHSDILYHTNNSQSNQNNWITHTWQKYPLNIEIDSTYLNFKIK